MRPFLAACLVVLAACEGNIAAPGASVAPVDPANPVIPPGTLRPRQCKSRGAGAPAQMRLLWRGAYLQELTTTLGPEASALAAAKVSLSPATTKHFHFESAGSFVSDVTLESVADAADDLAAWAISTPAFAQRTFGCNTATVNAAQAEACFRAFLSGKGARLLRRTLDPAELEDHVAFFKEEAAKGTGVDEGFRQGLARLLMHPDFIYLRDRPLGSTAQLDTFSIASRLSFALTGHGPDDALFAAAKDGSLADPAVVKTHVERLLATADARAELKTFFRGWLGHDSLSTFAFSPAFLDGASTTGLHDAAVTEVDDFVLHLSLDPQATPADLLTSRYLPTVPSTLSSLYGATGTELPAARAGLLTRVGLLASGVDSWSVVGRGVNVLERVLCAELAPPANVDLGAAAKAAEALRVSFADRIKSVTTPAGCTGCHKSINPLGTARSDFDALGRSVTTEKHFAGGAFDYEVPVVADADLTALFGRELKVKGSVELSNAIAASPEYQACFGQQLTAKALGRNLDADGCVAEDAARVVREGGSITAALTAVLTSPDFLLWKE